MSGKRNAYQKAYYAANKPYFAAYRRENSVLIAKYASGYYRENQRRYAEGQRFLQEARMRLGWSQAAVAAQILRRLIQTQCFDHVSCLSFAPVLQ